MRFLTPVKPSKRPPMARPLTKQDLHQWHLEQSGSHTCSTRLPHFWASDVYLKTGEWPGMYNIVWCYGPDDRVGDALALDPEAEELLRDYQQARAQMGGQV
jgi:hypothetical protein